MRDVVLFHDAVPPKGSRALRDASLLPCSYRFEASNRLTTKPMSDDMNRPNLVLKAT